MTPKNTGPRPQNRPSPPRGGSFVPKSNAPGLAKPQAAGNRPISPAGNRPAFPSKAPGTARTSGPVTRGPAPAGRGPVPASRKPVVGPLSRPPNSAPKPTIAAPKPSPAFKTDWADVAEWYDKLVGDEGSEYHQKVVFPGAMRMLQIRPGDPILDVACGQGAFCRLLAGKGATPVGIDAAEPLVQAARERGPAEISYHVGDVRELERMPFIAAGQFAAAACLLAIQNIHPIGPVFTGAARALRPWGRLVVVMMHPCFRGAKETGWGWDGDTQFRRIDRYLIPRKTPIVTHPGSDPDRYTWTFHKPIEAYVRAARGAGLLIDAIEEWPSHKTSQPGPRAAAENQAREEIPMFMAMRCIKVGKEEG